MNNTTVSPMNPRNAALSALANPKQRLSGKLRRQLFRNTYRDVGGATRTEPKDDSVRMSNRLARATAAQLNKWILRVNRRLPSVEKTLEDAKAAGLTRAVNLLQIKADQLRFLLRGFVTEVSFRNAKITDIAAAKAAAAKIKTQP